MMEILKRKFQYDIEKYERDKRSLVKEAKYMKPSEVKSHIR